MKTKFVYILHIQQNPLQLVVVGNTDDIGRESSQRTGTLNHIFFHVFNTLRSFFVIVIVFYFVLQLVLVFIASFAPSPLCYCCLPKLR